MHALVSDGMTQKQLADALDITEGAVSRNFKKLGPEGSGCLFKEGRLVKADPHVIKAVSEILQKHSDVAPTT